MINFDGMRHQKNGNVIGSDNQKPKQYRKMHYIFFFAVFCNKGNNTMSKDFLNSTRGFDTIFVCIEV